MRMGFARSAAGVMALLFGVANVAGATGVGSQPLAVQSASLTQNGEQLIWQLQMSEPFSPEHSPATGARSACWSSVPITARSLGSCASSAPARVSGRRGSGTRP